MGRLTVLALIATLAAAATACSGGGPKPVPSASPTYPAAPPTATVTPPPTPTPRPPGSPPQYSGAPRRVLIARGGLVNAETGVLFLDPATGGGEFWQLPDGTYPRVISADGRFIAWNEVTELRTGTQVAHILDTSTGVDRKSEFGGERLQPDRFSPDGSRFAGLAGRTLVVAASDSGQVQQTLAVGGPAEPYLQAEWSPDGTDLAAAAFNAAETWLIVDGAARSIPVTMRGLEWSHDGTRVAVSSLAGTRIVSLAGAPDTELPTGGSNPRWSFDDAYLSINGPDLNAGTDTRIFDSRTGAEVLRVIGVGTCFGDYWVRGEAAIRGRFDANNKVLVPSGALASLARFETAWSDDRGQSLDFRDGDSALVKDGQTLAEVQGGSSIPYVSDQLDIFHGGRATVYIGVGGKGLCGEGLPPPFEVQTPPFLG